MIYVLLLIATVISCVYLYLIRKKLNYQWYAAIIMGVLNTLFGLLFVKLFAFMEEGFTASAFKGTSLFGAFFFMPILYIMGAKIFKRKIGDVADVMTPVTILAIMCARINCLSAGCCIGKLIPGMNAVRFPTREVELIYYAIILCLLVPKIVKNKTHGTAYPIYMMSYGSLRFILEFMRENQNPVWTHSVFHLGHVWAVLALVIGVAVYIVTTKKNKVGIKKK